MKKQTKTAKKIICQADKLKKQQSGEERTLSIGSYAKMKRLQKRMTQEDASKGICSLSYVSKVEANKIKLNERIQTLLFERLEVNRLEIALLENVEEETRELIENNFYEDKTFIMNKYSEISDINGNIVALLYKMNYHLIMGDSDKSLKCADELSNYVGAMSVATISMYAYLTAESYHLSCLYSDALEITEAVSRLSNLPIKMKILLTYSTFKNSLNLGRFAMSLYHYNDLVRSFAEYNCLRRLNELKMYYYEILFASGEYEALLSSDEIRRNAPGDFRFDEYYYMIGISAFHLGRKEFSKEALGKINTKSKYFSMALPRLYSISDEEEKEKLYETAKEKLMIEEEFHTRYFYDMVNGELSGDNFKSSTYRNAIKNANIFERNHIHYCAYKFFKEKCKYKEALSEYEAIRGYCPEITG